MDSVTYIYGLVDPRTSVLRYVGKSNNPRVRYTKHINDKTVSHKCSWIEQLRALGFVPWLIIIDIVPIEQWQQYEADLIMCFGDQLTNIAAGGIAPKHSEETRLKQSLAKRGKAPHNKGKITSIESRKKQSVAAKLRFERMTPDERKAYTKRQNENRTPESYAHKGHTHTEETRLKIGKASKGNKHTAVLSKDQVLEIVVLIESGAIKLKDIGFIYGVGIQTISNIKNGRSYADWSGIQPNKNDFRVTLSHLYGKLSDKQVFEVLSLLQQGVKQSEIALMFNVSKPMISNINTGKRYKHVKRPNGD